MFMKYILNRTSNNWLNTDINQLREKLRQNYFPKLIIRSNILSSITAHISELQNGISTLPLNVVTREERIRTLRTFTATQLNKSIHITTKDMETQQKRNFRGGMVYSAYCIPFWKIINKFHKQHELPTPVMRTERISYKNLNIATPQNKRKNTAENTAENPDPNNNPRIGITKCNTCEEYFIIYNEDNGNLENNLAQMIADESSEIAKHLKDNQHEEPQKVFTLANLRAGSNIAARIALYKALMETNGISCHKTDALEQIPDVIERTIAEIIKQKRFKTANLKRLGKTTNQHTNNNKKTRWNKNSRKSNAEIRKSNMENSTLHEQKEGT